jgi:hypothetical protein
MKVRYIVFAATLAASPLAAAFAQSTSPSTKADSMTESTAMKNGSATNPNQAGATGSTVVPGDKSSVAGDRKGTAEQKTGQTTGSGK